MGRIAAVACIAAAAIAFVALTLHSRQGHVVGSNGIRPSLFVGQIPAKARTCETAGTASAPIDRVRITIGTNHRPQPLRLELLGGRPGPVVQGYHDGPVALRLATRAESIQGPVCVRNLGARPVQIAGEQAAPGQGATIHGRRADFHVSYTLLDDRPPRWWSQASSTLARVGLGRAGAGGRDLGAIVVVLLVASLLATLGTAWRWIR